MRSQDECAEDVRNRRYSMSEFKRCLDRKIISRLLDVDSYEGRIFKSLLYPRIMTGQIFMAVRVDKIDFYVGANRLMEYSGRCYKANAKIFDENETSRMVDIKKVFESGWENDFDSMIEKCYGYTSNGSEQAERKIIQAFFPVYDRKDKVIVLDREIRINDGNGRKCDWLLYNTGAGLLKFVEVKTADNSGIKRHENGTFDVTAQLAGYERQYETHKEKITEQYQGYVDIINDMLKIQLPKPAGMLDTKAGLAIFGNKKEIHPELIRKHDPFMGEYKPEITSSLEDIWNHFDQRKERE